ERPLCPFFGGTVRDKCNVARDEQFDFCSCVSAAPDFETSANTLSTFTHPGQSPVAVPAQLDYVRIYAGAIVSNQDFQVFRSVFKFDFDFTSSGVPKGVRQSLANYAIDLIANY